MLPAAAGPQAVEAAAAALRMRKLLTMTTLLWEQLMVLAEGVRSEAA